MAWHSYFVFYGMLLSTMLQYSQRGTFIWTPITAIHLNVFTENNKKGCRSPTVLDSKTQLSVALVFDYFNKQKGINYNLCFSSLYFTIKSNQYDSFHSGHGFGFDELNEQCKSRNSLKCVETEGECDMIEIKSWKFFKNCR